MARIAGITLPNNKRIEVALTYVFGIGTKIAQDILEQAKVDGNTRTKDLSDSEVNNLQTIVKEYKTEGDLKREVLQNVKRLKEINSYRGGRHAKRLPGRGQRTKTNSRTLRGNVRKTAGSGKKVAAQKT